MPTLVPESPCFTTAIEKGVAHVRLNRPEAFNAMNPHFWNDLPDIIRAIDRGALARVIVLSAAGKHFSAGMDLTVFQKPDGIGGTGEAHGDQWVRAETFRHHCKQLQDSFSCLEQARMPVIACIQGGAVGAGVDLATACDIRLATRDAFFCIQEVNIAMTADVGTFPRICKLMPEGWVRQMAYTGERLPATRALQLGLVNDLFDTADDMLAHAMAMAAEIARRNPLAVTGSKAMINYARDHSVADALDYVATWNASMLARSHMAESFKAKAEGREPVFPDLLALHDKPF